MMNERTLLGTMIIKNDEKKVELSEKTQKILYDIDYYRRKILYYVDRPIIKIPVRIICITLLVIIAVTANYGIYSAINIYQNGIYPLEEWRNINRTIFILNMAAQLILIYVYYNILLAIYKIIRDIFSR